MRLCSSKDTAAFEPGKQFLTILRLKQGQAKVQDLQLPTAIATATLTLNYWPSWLRDLSNYPHDSNRYPTIIQSID